jgi:lipopolysaccharide/colanic/teichoic acid biosynthesis glycosyltransferase
MKPAGHTRDRTSVPISLCDAHGPSRHGDRPAGTSPPYMALKRAVDVAVAAGVLTVSAPVWGWVAIRIKLADGGPVLYRGARVGLHGEPFRILKFRTMVIGAESLGGSNTAADDPRLTHVGKTLRHWKLDELPQLVNVLRGEMSLVGPRPQVVDEVDRYTADERRLLTVRPGITDWATVIFRNEEELLAGHADVDRTYDELIRPRKIALGLRYVEQRSLRADLRILVLTVRAILQPTWADVLIARELPTTTSGRGRLPSNEATRPHLREEQSDARP